MRLPRPDKTAIIIILLGAILALSVATSLYVFTQRQEAVAAKANAAAIRTRQNAELIHERIVIGRIRNQITEDAIHELCIRMNNKFGKLIPLELQAKKQVLRSPLYNGHEKQRQDSLRLINQALAALQPESCDIKLDVPTEPPLAPPVPVIGENG